MKYLGYDKHDGMNSKILNKDLINHKWLNFFFQEIVKRSPINLRPLLLINKERSFKGISLFALSYFNLYRKTGDSKYLKEATELVSWLIENASKGYSGFCGGHRHPRQQIDRFVPANTPSVVPTFFAVEALISAYKINCNDKYLNVAYSTANFVKFDLSYKEERLYAMIKYKPGDSDKVYTLNANALGARIFLSLYREIKEEHLLRSAEKILNYVVSRQKRNGGWMYTDPSESSHLKMDNYHNGFIIEALLEYEIITKNKKYDTALSKALGFYENVLFNKDGSPNWDNRKRYPKDIHSCAQGIIVFSKLGKIGFAKRIIEWTICNLYNKAGHFYYQKSPFFTKKVVLMRWAQAWMCYALSIFLLTFKKSQ